MIRLDENNNVIYNNSINLGEIETLNNTGNGFSINLPDGSMVFIPEEDCSSFEKEIFEAWKSVYPDGKPEKVDIEALKQSIIQKIKLQCQDTIYAGFDSDIKYGEMKHYTLKDYEQSNIQALVISIMGGATCVPWRHTDIPVCDTWTSEEFLQFYRQAMAFIVNKRYKSDVIELYLMTEELTEAEILAVDLEMELPQAYHDIYIEKLNAVGVSLWV